MDNWFTVEEIDSKTYSISEYKHYEETHCYLLIGNDKCLLIDTGLGIGNIQEVVNSLTYNFREQISKIVTDYIKDSLADDIKKMLNNEKENMLNEIQKSCITIAAEVGKKMVEVATTNLTSSYKSEDIVKKIFN